MTRTALSLLRRAVVYEIRLWHSLYRWALRRPVGVGPGDETFGYTGAVMTLMWVFIGVSAIEIPILELMLPWETVRTIALAAGVYGLFWMIGLLASLKVYPHVVGDAGLRVRYGISIDLTIPWEAVDTVRVNRRSLPPEGRIQLERNGTEVAVSFGMASQTSVDVLLREPTVLPVPKTRGEPVTELRFHADDPEALVAQAGDHLTARRDQTRG